MKPASNRPIQPALDTHRAGQALGLPTGIRATPAMLGRHPAAARPPQSLSRTEKAEGLVLKLVTIILALACIGCGFGIQHIAYVRQKNELCRQLRQKEGELRSVTQAYRSLESSVFAKAAEDFRRPETCPVIAKHAPRRVPTRG